MPQDPTQTALVGRLAALFSSRLLTLKRLLDTAAKQWRAAGRDPETLLTARLAPDMFALPHQVAFACRQAEHFAIFLTEGPGAKTDSLGIDPGTLAFEDFGALIDAAIERLDAALSADPARLEAEKRVNLGNGLSLEMPGAAYVNDWLIANLYFHLVTAYDILRHAGVTIGKADYMAHAGPYLRRLPSAA